MSWWEYKIHFLLKFLLFQCKIQLFQSGIMFLLVFLTISDQNAILFYIATSGHFGPEKLLVIVNKMTDIYFQQ
jgi:hypothetical protein